MIKITLSVVVFGSHRTFFDTASALDTDACKFADIIKTDGTHRTDFHTQLAVVTAVRSLWFDFAYVYRVAFAVPWLIIALRRILTADIKQFAFFRAESIAQFIIDIICKCFSHFHVRIIRTTGTENFGKGMFSDKCACSDR